MLFPCLIRQSDPPATLPTTHFYSMNNQAFDLRLLRVFDALIAERNVTLAAGRLHLSQSAVSQALAKLRAAMGDPLFVRKGHSMEPTAKALAVAVPIRQALDTISGALDLSLSFDTANSRRSFRIATTDHALMVLLPSLAKKVSERAPSVDLVIAYVNLDRGMESIRDGSIDLLIAYFVVTKVPSNFRTRQLFRDSFVVVARKGHPKFRSGMSLSAFAEAEHVVVAPRNTWLPGPLDTALSKLGLKRNIRVMLPQFVIAPYVVAETDLIATIPARAAANVTAGLPIEVYPLPLDAPRFKVEMAWDERHHHDPGHRWLRNQLIETAKTV